MTASGFSRSHRAVLVELHVDLCTCRSALALRPRIHKFGASAFGGSGAFGSASFRCCQRHADNTTTYTHDHARIDVGMELPLVEIRSIVNVWSVCSDCIGVDSSLRTHRRPSTWRPAIPPRESQSTPQSLVRGSSRFFGFRKRHFPNGRSSSRLHHGRVRDAQRPCGSQIARPTPGRRSSM